MAFSLSGIFKSVSSFGGGDGSVLGIDIGSSSAKIVQLRASRGIAILETYGEIALGPYGHQPIGKAVKLSPEKTAEALIDLMKEANVTARQGGISIPFSSSLVSVIDLPNVDKESLKRIIPIEARKYIPIPIGDVTLDWFVIPRDESGEDSAFDQIQEVKPKATAAQEVLLVAIHNDLLQEYQTVAGTAGVTANFYEIEIFSAVRSSVGHGIAPILVVDLGASTTKMYVVERGVVRLTHLVTQGGQQMTEVLGRSLGWEFEKAERVKRERGLIDSTAYSVDENDRIKTAVLSTLSRVFSEVNRVLLSYGQRYNKNVAHVVLTGGGAALPGLMLAAKEQLSGEVEIANPFSRTEAPAFLENVLRQIGPGFAVAVGLALRKLRHD
ncbi:type IV pilus assembly protein PilM [Candidatus Kaiserbacteria bacterium]|nr:type IV pilus assembly protein PilM [Candidatus Kaiserbacteria bacterium]